MENQIQQAMTASEKTKSTETMVLQVAGRYQLFEFKKTGTEKALIALPITVHAKQQADLLTVELYNENENTTTLLKYPMNGGPAWSEERKAFVFTRPVGSAIVADVISTTSACFRITWEVDDKGRILESFEEFDVDGNRLESSPGHLRTLVPIL